MNIIFVSLYKLDKVYAINIVMVKYFLIIGVEVLNWFQSDKVILHNQ